MSGKSWIVQLVTIITLSPWLKPLIHSLWCGGGSRPRPTWAETISMASCLISNPGNSANTDSIHQAQEGSHPWTNKQTISIVCKSNKLPFVYPWVCICLVSKTFSEFSSLGVQNCFLFKVELLVLSNSVLTEREIQELFY